MAKVDTGWQPIETAPKDGTKVDLWVKHIDTPDHRECDMVMVDGVWRRSCGKVLMSRLEDVLTPTHWMLPPAPPETRRGEREEEIGEFLGIDPRHPLIAEVVEIERGERNTDGSWKK